MVKSTFDEISRNTSIGQLIWAFLNLQSWEERGHHAPYHNFVVISLMVMKFGTGKRHDVFYIMVTKIVTLLLLGNYDVITYI